jgi:hypothetical protein
MIRYDGNHNRPVNHSQRLWHDGNRQCRVGYLYYMSYGARGKSTCLLTTMKDLIARVKMLVSRKAGVKNRQHEPHDRLTPQRVKATKNATNRRGGRI